MSKMSAMAQTIGELRSAAAAIAEAANWLAQAFASEAEEPTAAPTMEQVRAVLADKSRAGHTAAIRKLLQKYGASRLSEVDPANYQALMKEVEVLEDAT